MKCLKSRLLKGGKKAGCNLDFLLLFYKGKVLAESNGNTEIRGVGVKMQQLIKVRLWVCLCI